MAQTGSLDYFQEVSEDWDEMASSFFGDAPRNQIMSIAKMSSIRTVADIGCGTGYLTEAFKNHPAQVFAIDQSTEMLKQMAVRFKDNKNIVYLPGSSDNLPLEDESMDMVMANMYLHHVEDPAVAIKEMARLLRPGAQLIFTDLDKHDHEFLITEQHDRWMGFEREDIKIWLQEAGLEEIILDCVGSNCCANSSCEGDSASINIFIAKATKPVKKLSE